MGRTGPSAWTPDAICCTGPAARRDDLSTTSTPFIDRVIGGDTSIDEAIADSERDQQARGAIDSGPWRSCG